MKTPKGLKTHRSNLKIINLDLSKAVHLENWDEMRHKYKTWEEMEKSKLYQGKELLETLCSSIAEDITGYSHFSNLFDEGPQYALKDYANYEDNSEDDESSSEDFDKYNHYEEIKDGFKNKVVSSFKTFDFKKSESTQKLYNHCVKMKAFDGTYEEFTNSLKHSQVFLNYLGSHIVRYTG